MSEGEAAQRTAARTLGRYQIIRRIGRGGMGDVWLCDDPRLHRQVAIKTLPAQSQQDREFSQRFEREAQASAALGHPHILPIYDYGEQPTPNGQVVTYIVMPYVSGGSLTERIAAYQTKQTLMPPQEAIAYLSQAAEAIDYAHAQGIIHRDIKPGNMLLRDDRWLLLTDFGIAHILSSAENLTQTGVGIGTPEYMAPEQAEGRAEAASDIYSLAVLAYYLFTGRLPFNAETSYATTIQHMTMPPPPLRQFNPVLPPAFETALLRGLAKQPAERPGSARIFATSLQQAFAGTPFEALMTSAAPYSSATGQPNTFSTITQPTVFSGQQSANQNAPVAQRGGRSLSRRNIIIGGGAALLVVGGLGTWAAVSKFRGTPNQQAKSAPTPTPNPNGPNLILQGHLKPASSLAWSPQKNVLASIADQDDLLLWDITKQQSGSPDPIARRKARKGSSMLLSWSPDGNMLALANTEEGLDNAAIDFYTSDISKLAPGFTNYVTGANTATVSGMCWTNKTTLVTVTHSPLNSNDSNHFRLWAMDVTQPGQHIKAIPIAGSLGGGFSLSTPPQLLATSPDGTLIAISLYNTIIIGKVSLIANTVQWQQTSTLQFEKNSFEQSTGVFWAPDGRNIGTFYQSNVSSLYLWNWPNKQKNTPAKELDTNTKLITMAWSPTPKNPLIATASTDGNVQIWNPNKGTTPVGTLNGGEIANKKITALSWSADGQWLAAGYDDNDTSILVWKIQGRGF
jgi:eukaryotic-like serine/threonine-protein kinase